MNADYAESSPKSFKTSCWFCEVPMCTECLTSQWTQWISCLSPGSSIIRHLVQMDRAHTCYRRNGGHATGFVTMEGHRIDGFARVR